MRHSQGTGTLRAALQAAQADAERLHGQGPAPAWRGPSRRIGGPLAAVASALVAVGAWTGLQGDDLPMPVLQVARQAPHPAAPQWQAPAATSAVAPTLGVAAPPVAAPLRVAPPPAAPAMSDEPPPQAPDADDWALHPDSALPVEDRGPLALGNRPDLPDEHDATPAEESVADEDPGGATPP